MEQASAPQILERKIEGILQLFAADIWPCLWTWLLIASLFIVCGVLVIKAPLTMKAAFWRLISLSLFCAGVGTFVHLALSFGEAFASRVNPYRLPIYYSFTAAFCAIGIYSAWRRRSRVYDT